jgi:hypothetical protein
MGEPPPPVETRSGAELWMHDAGMAFSVGGGVDDFAGSTLGNATSLGGSWTARLSIGSRSFVGGELSYIGSAQTISQLGLASNSELIGNGAQAALRLNGTIDYPFQPFIYGGVAWRHYSLNTSRTNLSDVTESNDALEVPAGIGLAAYYDGLMMDVRGEYRWGWLDKAMIPSTSTSTSNANRWGVTGNIGYAF